jgi:hypothetical protein
MKVTGASSFGGNMTLSLNQNAATSIDVINTTNNAASDARVNITSNSGLATFGKNSATKTVYKIITASDAFFYNGTGSGDLTFLNDFSTGNIKFAAGGSSTVQMTLTTVGRLILGAGDTGELLQINGTSKITGASSFGNNMTLSFNQNGETGFTVSNTTNNTASQSLINLTSNNGTGIIGKYSQSKTTYKTLVANDYYLYTANGDISILNDNASGNIKFAAGGSSTAQMTIKSNGRINMSSLPTSSTGLATGDLWNDSGTIKIV